MEGKGMHKIRTWYRAVVFRWLVNTCCSTLISSVVDFKIGNLVTMRL